MFDPLAMQLTGRSCLWDADPQGQTISSYRSDAPATPLVFQSADVPNAELALPGWMVKVAEVLG